MPNQRVIALSKFREWIESPACEVLKEALKLELDKVYKERSDTFYEGKPGRTHEVRSNLIGQEGILRDMIDLLNVDNEVLEQYFEGNGILIVKTPQEVEIELYGKDVY